MYTVYASMLHTVPHPRSTLINVIIKFKNSKKKTKKIEVQPKNKMSNDDEMDTVALISWLNRMMDSVEEECAKIRSLDEIRQVTFFRLRPQEETHVTITHTECPLIHCKICVSISIISG